MILKEWINLNRSCIDLTELYYLLKNIFEIDVLNDLIELSPLIINSLNICLDMRAQGVPLAKILHQKWFYNDCFVTTADTLDPRPETEFIIEKITGTPRSVLELGTGTGCLLLSIVKKFYKAKGVGIDISEKALDVAKRNRELLKLDKKVEFLQNNWANNLSGFFDLVISNPPYVNKDMKLSKETLNDPDIALFGSEQTYLDIKNSLKNIMFKQLLLEVPDYLVKSVCEIFKDYKNIESFQVYNTSIYVLSINN